MRRFGPLLGLAILVTVLSLASPQFLTVDNILNVFRQSSINGLLALGQLLVILTAGIDLSVGSMLGLSTVVFAKSLKAGVHPAVAVGLALVCGLALGLLNGLLLTVLRLT